MDEQRLDSTIEFPDPIGSRLFFQISSYYFQRQSLNVRIDDSDDRLAPAVLEILGIASPPPGDAGELPRCFSGLRRFQSSPLYFALECRDDYTLW